MTRSESPGTSLATWHWRSAEDRPLDADGTFSGNISPAIEGRTVFDCFANRAERNAGEAAIVEQDATTHSFGEVLARARAVAKALVAVTRPDERVAILMASGPDYPVAVLACFAAGRLFAPLDLRFPASRNATVFADFTPACVICSQNSKEIRAMVPDARIIDLCEVTLSASDHATNPLQALTDIDAASFVLYTSGSSGRPKGIVNSQRAILQRVRQQVGSVHAGPSDTLICLVSPCTIAGMREMLTALLCGATLRMIDPEALGLRETRRLIGLGGTLLYSVPSFMKVLCSHGGAPDDLSKLRMVRLGGEKVCWDDIIVLRQSLGPNSCIQIGYSSTETTGSQRFVGPDEIPCGASPSVGWLLPGIEYAVLDENDRNVLDGEDGELVLRSPFIALGQWRDGRCDPSGYEDDGDGARTFRTGDIARIEPGGSMRILGRRDRQIKINGRRVEPQEIEAALRAEQGVLDAVIIPVGTGRETRIIGFLVAAAANTNGLVDRVRAGFGARLPTAWCPTRIHLLPELPRLPGGKLDAIALRSLDEAFVARQAIEENDTGMPTNVMEAMVAKAWMTTLGRRPARSGFGEAGGDSLSLLRLVFEIEEASGRKIPLDRLRMDMTAPDIARAITHDHQVSPARKFGEQRPVVLLFPGLNGDSPSLASFRTDLGDHFHFAVAQYPSWRRMVTTNCSFGALVDVALTSIAAAMPEGPVRIAGYSLGGAVGYELARRLNESGRAIEWFVVLDTDVSPRRVGRGLDGWCRASWNVLTSLRRRESAIERLACALATWLTHPRNRPWLQRLVEAKRIEALPASLRFALEMQICEMLQQRAFHRWIEDMKPSGRLEHAFVLRSQERRKSHDPSLGWKRYFEDVTIRAVSGDHREMLRQPHRKGLVENFIALISSSAIGATKRSHA